MLKRYLEKVLSGQDLSNCEMDQALELLSGSDISAAQAGAFLAALRMKGESVSELLGGAQMLRRNATYIDCGGREVVDVVGTGGDNSQTFNISTTAALAAAGAGIVIAKHGNRAVSGKCGAADVLAELGFNLEVSVAAMENSICEHGIGFMFAQRLHPKFALVAPLRRALGIRTIFNMLGPLCNPAGATRMVVGVFSNHLTELFAGALGGLGVKHALVVHSNDGLDEISCGDSTRVTELREGRLRTYEIYPEMLLGDTCDLAELAGGDAARNAAILLSVLRGEERGGARAVVLLNAAAACYVGGLAENLSEGIRLAEDSLDSGKAMAKLELLIEGSHGV